MTDRNEMYTETWRIELNKLSADTLRVKSQRRGCRTCGWEQTGTGLSCPLVTIRWKWMFSTSGNCTGGVAWCGLTDHQKIYFMKFESLSKAVGWVVMQIVTDIQASHVNLVDRRSPDFYSSVTMRLTAIEWIHIKTDRYTQGPQRINSTEFLIPEIVIKARCLCRLLKCGMLWVIYFYSGISTCNFTILM